MHPQSRVDLVSPFCAYYKNIQSTLPKSIVHKSNNRPESLVAQSSLFSMFFTPYKSNFRPLSRNFFSPNGFDLGRVDMYFAQYPVHVHANPHMNCYSPNHNYANIFMKIVSKKKKIICPKSLLFTVLNYTH